MLGNESHISDARISKFAHGELILEAGEIEHFQNCDQCSDKWWRLKQEKRNRRPGGDETKEKSA